MNITPLTTNQGFFTISAFDHRSSFGEMMGIDLESEVGVAQMKQLKKLFMEVFSPLSSAVLTDPIYGLESLAFKAPASGLLLSLEESGYDGGKEVVPPLLQNWGVAGVKAHGAAAKLLLYLVPGEVNQADKIRLVEELYDQTRAQEVPFLLEPVVYDHEHYLDDLLRTVTLLTDKCDVLKLEYPGLKSASRDEVAEACERVTQLATVPWILLSRGMKYEAFKEALQVSMEQGAKGFAVGRAVWQEIEEFSVAKTGDWQQTLNQTQQFLETTGVSRMQELIKIVNSYGR